MERPLAIGISTPVPGNQHRSVVEGADMIYVLFKTEVPPHKAAEFHELFAKLVAFMERHGAKNVGAWQTELGPLGEFLYIWAVEDMAAYERALAGLLQDVEAAEVRAKLLPLYSNRERRILRPTPYSPLR